MELYYARIWQCFQEIPLSAPSKVRLLADLGHFLEGTEGGSQQVRVFLSTVSFSRIMDAAFTGPEQESSFR